MRIGIFSECYLPTLNGVVVSIETFRQELEKRGHEYFIFAPATKGYKDRNKKHVFRFSSMVLMGQKYYPVGLPFLNPIKIRQIKDLKLDIIHTQHLFNMGSLGLKVGRKLNIPVVHTYHTLITEYTHYFPFWQKKVRQALIKVSRNYCNKCDQIITPSPSMQRLLKRYGVTKPIEAIPTGINLAEHRNPYNKSVIRAKWQIPEHQKILLYLSRIAKEKNIRFLLRAMRLLIEARERKMKKVDVHLLMVGGGPEIKTYQELVKKWNLEAFVTFTDMIEKEKANRYFGAADIFVFPSITETQGIVVTEALAAGTPVVAIDKMGPSDLIKDREDGFLTDLNLEEFVVKIEKLLDDDKLRQEMSKNGMKNAEQYSSLNCAKKMEKIYEETIDRYRSQSNT